MWKVCKSNEFLPLVGCDHNGNACVLHNNWIKSKYIIEIDTIRSRNSHVIAYSTVLKVNAIKTIFSCQYSTYHLFYTTAKIFFFLSLMKKFYMIKLDRRADINFCYYAFIKLYICMWCWCLQIENMLFKCFSLVRQMLKDRAWLMCGIMVN